MTTPIIAFINPDPAHPERCGECPHVNHWDDDEAGESGTFCDVFGGCDGFTRCDACLAAEKLMRDLREAGEMILVTTNAKREWSDLHNALAAIDAARKEQG